MKEVVISVPEEEYSFVMKLLRRLDFIKVKEPLPTKDELAPSRQEFLDGIKDAITEVNEIKQGKRKGQSLQSFLDEV